MHLVRTRSSRVLSHPNSPFRCGLFAPTAGAGLTQPGVLGSVGLVAGHNRSAPTHPAGWDPPVQRPDPPLPRFNSLETRPGSESSLHSGATAVDHQGPSLKLGPSGRLSGFIWLPVCEASYAARCLLWVSYVVYMGPCRGLYAQLLMWDLICSQHTFLR